MLTGVAARITLMRIRNRSFTTMRIHLSFLCGSGSGPVPVSVPHQSDPVLRPLAYRDPPRLHYESMRLHCERPRLSMAPFRTSTLQLLNFDLDADPEPDPGFHSDAALL